MALFSWVFHRTPPMLSSRWMSRRLGMFGDVLYLAHSPVLRALKCRSRVCVNSATDAHFSNRISRRDTQLNVHSSVVRSFNEKIFSPVSDLRRFDGEIWCRPIFDEIKEKRSERSIFRSCWTISSPVPFRSALFQVAFAVLACSRSMKQPCEEKLLAIDRRPATKWWIGRKKHQEDWWWQIVRLVHRQ